MRDIGAVAVLAGVAGLYIWNLKNAASNLVYTPGDITGFTIDGISPIIYADLIIQNTSNIEFTINSLAGNVTCDSTQVGNISNFTPVRILPNSQGALPLTLKMLPIGLVNNIISVITGGAGSKVLKLDGSVNANGVQSAFSMTFKAGV